MEVFVLMGEIAYEGDYLLGVYASEQEAVDALGVYLRDRSSQDHYYVDRRVVGAGADLDFDHRYI
jgi:hypothetical protein